jgi:cell division protein FtsB
MTENELNDNQPAFEEPAPFDQDSASENNALQEPVTEELDENALPFEQTPEPEIAPEQKPEKIEEKKPPTRFQLFLRKMLIGLIVVGLLFLAGFLTNHFTRYKPLADTLDETRIALDEANQAVNDLEAENIELKDSNKKADKAIETLQAELSAVRANALFYQTLVDVSNARIALFLDDNEGAQAALANTEAQLEELQPAIDAVDPDLAITLLARLELVVSGLNRDKETSLIDLELFTKSLLELEPLLALD